MSIRFLRPISIAAAVFSTLLFGGHPTLGQQPEAPGGQPVLHLDSLLQAAGRANPSLRADRESVLQSLARLTGRTDLEEPSQPVKVAVPSEFQEVGGRVGQGVDDRPEAEALRQRIEKAESETALARRAFWPDFTVGAAYTDVRQGNLTPTMTGRDAFNLSVGVTIPLWRGKQEARLEEPQGHPLPKEDPPQVDVS